MNAQHIDARGEKLIGFSTRLRQLLMQRGHTIVPAQLARDFTFASSRPATAQTFSNWLNGVQMPLSVTVNALAEWLHTTADYLHNGVSVLHFAPARDSINDPEAQQLLQHFMQLTPYGRRVASGMVAGLVKLQAGGA
jgi:hypothetical protein